MKTEAQKAAEFAEFRKHVIDGTFPDDFETSASVARTAAQDATMIDGQLFSFLPFSNDLILFLFGVLIAVSWAYSLHLKNRRRITNKATYLRAKDYLDNRGKSRNDEESQP